jgi:hypothetical protein
MPPFTYDGKGGDSAGSNYSLTLRDMLDPQTAESKSSVHSNVCVGNWQPTGYRHKVGFEGTQLEYTWVDDDGKTRRAYGLNGCCPIYTHLRQGLRCRRHWTDCMHTLSDYVRARAVPRTAR